YACFVASGRGLGGGLWHQRVTARFGNEDGRAGSVPLDLLPQPIDVRLERVGGDAGVIAPDLLQQGLARNRTLAGAIEISQDRGLLLREPHLVALGIEQNLRARAERVRADGEYGVLARLVLAQLRADACEQHGKVEWFGHVVVGAGLEPEDGVGIGIV